MACSVCNQEAGYQSGHAGTGQLMPCSQCGGSGVQIRETSEGAKEITCGHCNGTGTCTK